MKPKAVSLKWAKIFIEVNKNLPNSQDKKKYKTEMREEHGNGH